MTTANLSVGIKTDKAREGMRDLKRKLAQEMGSVAVQVNEQALVNGIKQALERTKFYLNVDQSRFSEAITGTLGKVFSHRYHLLINTDSLTQSVRESVSAGMRGVNLGGVGGTGAPAGVINEVKTAITELVAKSVDDITKAAQQAVSSGGRSSIRASQRISMKDDKTGETTSVMQTLGDPALVLQNLRVANLKQINDKQEEQALREQQRESSRIWAFRRNWARSTARQEESLAQEAQADAQRTFAFRRNWARSTAREEENSLREAQTEANRTFSFRRNWARAAAKDEETALREAQSDSQRTFSFRRNWARSNEREEASSQREAQSDANRTYTFQRNFRRSQEREAAANMREEQSDAQRTFVFRRNFRRAEEQTLKASMEATFASARFSARDGFNAVGQNISGAQALVAKFGEQQARGFLGARGFLVDEISNLGNYRLKVKEAGEAVVKAKEHHVSLRDAMNDAHSAARGFAGSLGALWITWGNTAPIVAAAAIGGALRSVVVYGKEVEFQLKFVQVLSEGVAVSLSNFAAAMAGSLATPAEGAQALRGLAQNGLNAKESLQALPAILNLATAGEMSLSDAALGATGVMAAFNLQVGDLGRIGDVFAKAAASSNTNVTGMVEAMRQASTVSDQYHVSLEETAASLAVMAKRNITGTAAGTAFRNMMVELATPTEKAKQALKTLGLEVFNSDGKLKDYAQILEMVRAKTLTLNEQGKLTFLNEVFNERGAKAINAILSDYSEYGRLLDEVKNKSRDFSATVVQALGDTTEGRIRKLKSEFQLLSVEGFDRASDSINHFVDGLRIAVSSPEFKNFLNGLVESVTSLTTFLVDHGRAVVGLVAAWATLRAVDFVIGTFVTLKAALFGATAAMATASVAARALLGALTGGVALVVGLAIEYMVLGRNVDQASVAQKAMNDSLELNNQSMARSIGLLQQENALTATKIRLMAQGYSAAQASRMAEQEQAGSELSRLEKQRQAAQQTVDSAMQQQKAYDEWMSRPRKAGEKPPQPIKLVSPEQLAEAKRTLEQTDAQVRNFRTQQQENETKSRQDSLKKNYEQLKAFNDKVYDIGQSNKKADLSGISLVPSDANLSNEEFSNKLKERERLLNTRLTKYTPADKTAIAAAAAAAKAETKSVVEQIREEEAAIRQNIKFQRELADARYSSEEFGPYLAAKLADLAASREAAQITELEATALARLATERARYSAGQAEYINITREMEKRSADLARARDEAQHRRVVTGVRAEQVARKEAAQDASTLAALAAQDVERLEKLRQKTSLKVQSPGDAAAAEAALEVETQYRTKIVDAEQSLLQIRARLQDEQGRVNTMMGAERAQQTLVIEAAQARADHEQETLNILKAQRDVAKVVAAAEAKAQVERSRTAEFGYDRFWKDYTESAESSADMVYRTLKDAAKGLEEGMAQSLVKGNSLLAQFAREALKTLVIKPALTGLFGPGSTIGNGIRGLLGGNGLADLGSSALQAAQTASQTASTTATSLMTAAIAEATLALHTLAAAAAEASVSTGAEAATGSGGFFAGVGELFGLPGFARGGRYPTNRPVIVGEKGPEIAMFDRPGTIVSNDKIASLGSSTVIQSNVSPKIYIDSRSDAAQVAALVNQAVSSALEAQTKDLVARGVIAS